MDATLRTADESTIRLLDGLVAFWLVLWLVVAAWSGYTIWNLSGLGDTVTTTGEAIHSAGEALETVGAVPVIGEGPAEVGREVVAAGEDIAVRGQQVQSQLRQLSLLLGLSIAVMPTTPVLGLYLPLRQARRRDVAALQQALDRHGTDAAFDRYLAERAVHRMPYADVHAVTGDPWSAIDAGRLRPLADAELTRMGLSRPR